MAAIEALYLQDPFWLWLGLGCLFVSLNLATGSSLLMWPGIAAALVAVIELVGVRAGLIVETGIFLVLCLAALAFGVVLSPRTQVAVPGSSDEKSSGGGPPSAPGRQEQTSRLIGRIGRTSSEFVNGVGRVWIDGAEWAAELDSGEDAVPVEAPVRVTRVVGGIKLQVHPLSAG